jgi:hypothetical protein
MFFNEEVGIMNSIRLAVIAALLVSGTALGATSMTFELNTQGNNQLAAWEGASYDTNPWTYTGGSAAGGESYNAGDTVNWSVKLAVSGTYDVGGNPVKGAANIVFDLELRDAGNNLVNLPASNSAGTTPGWYSTINDGVADSARDILFPADVRDERAAFAASFNVVRFDSGDTPGGDVDRTRGRLVDTVPDDGPFMDYATYPSAAGHPAASTAAAGTLVGMGAGYSQYSASGCPDDTLSCPGATSTSNAGGVGLVIPGASALGTGPIGEGQINTTGLDGTYTLKLVARKSGNNVLKNFDPVTQSPGSFAEGVGAVVNNTGDGTLPAGDGGDVITFTVVGTGCLVPLELTSAKSRRTHGAAGDFDIDLPLAGPAGTESREQGPAIPATLILGFNQPVTNEPNGAVTCANIGLSAGACTGVAGSGTNTLTVTANFPVPPAGNTCLEVTVQNLHGDGACTLANQSFNARLLRGDADAPAGTVNIVDMNYVKLRLFQAVVAGNFLADISADGIINIVDMNAVKTNLFAQVATCP